MMDTKPRITVIGYNMTVKIMPYASAGKVTDPADELCPIEAYMFMRLTENVVSNRLSEINGRNAEIKKIIVPINAVIFQYSNFLTYLKASFTACSFLSFAVH